ncbi:MAG: UDP-N-acetylmuramoyl-L-alanyl-D-glutamate--2,6-diaminopimelate ligase [Bacteroidales bacterium]|nr:UDP-N-acetylmuramoyl-L-alanyl-D-glutamate--2,6-diaminopimelate ligase [Bacteroidales bacterium]
MQKKINDIVVDLKEVRIIGDASRIVEGVELDSRKCGPASMFVAQKGETVDGHNFISKVFEQGCRAVLCEKEPENYPSDATIVVCPDTHVALGLVASAFYDYPSKKMKLVGVTGTNGKTTTATLLYKLMMKMGHKSGLFSTVANYVGEEREDAKQTTPDSVTLARQMAEMVDKGCEYCFMEVSSHSVVQHRISGLDFDGAIFTNITHDHLDYHKTFDNYIEAKKGFFDGLKKGAFAITNVDDKNGMKMLQNTKADKKTCSLRTMADFKAKIVEHTFEGMLIDFDGQEAFMQFVGKFNAYNLLGIYGAAVCLGFDKQEVLTALSALTPVDGRFETIRSKDGKTAIVDYAHTPDALLNVIGTINEIRKKDQKLICVVGCGGDRDKTKRPEMAKEAAKGCTNVILTSDNPRSEEPEQILADMQAGLDAEDMKRTLTIADRREAIRTALTLAQAGDIVLIAGKGHEPYQEVKGVKHHFDDREEVKKVFGI